MIDFFFGKPRSGKSYRAVKLIYDEYIDPGAKTPKFKNILTNIGGFKFKEINEHFKIVNDEKNLANNSNDTQSVAYKLVWKEFYNHLTVMYDLAMNDSNDEELNDYAARHNINDCLIILDEASLYMKRYDDSISWWLSYHGHFKIRIIIITQSPKQINPEYMSHTEIFYEAQPQSKQLRSNQLRYIHYSDLPFNKDNKFSSNSITTNQDVYDLYKSGEVDKPKKIVYKFILLVILAFFAIFALYQYFIVSVKERVDINEDVKDVEIQNKIKSKDDMSYFNNGDILINIRCTDFYCWNNDDKYINNEISIDYLKFLVIKNKIELVYTESKNKVFKTKLTKKGLEYKTLSEIKDYFYFIDDSIKETYLTKLFILKQQTDNDKDLDIKNPFSISNESTNNEPK